MRRGFLEAVLAAVAVASPAAAQEVDRIAALEADVAEERTRMEALYVEAARQHAAIARDAASWTPTSAQTEALERFVVQARDGPGPSAPGRLEELVAVSGPAAAWSAWAPALLAELADRARRDVDAAALSSVRAMLREIASEDVSGAWDRHMRWHPTVVAWREAHTALADARRVAAARAPTPLVAFPKARVEVGPWDGWLQDLSEKDNRPQKVSVAALHVQQHEVTWAQYVDFLLARPPGEREALLPAEALDTDDGDPVAPYGREDHPVTGVSFVQATAYATWLGMRLPTEDEWERIAAGGDADRAYPWGPDVGGVHFASRALGAGGTVAVRSCPDDATPELVLGLAGNVKELVATHPDRKPVKGTPKADAQVVIRGGGFRTRPDECTTRWRWFVEAGAQEPDVGFRCVIDDADLRRRERR